jgi:hypothetical protein
LRKIARGTAFVFAIIRQRAVGEQFVDKDPRIVDGWQRDLRKKIAWAMAAKLLGLFLLWFLFFRGHGS